jgi:hypothetical protein
MQRHVLNAPREGRADMHSSVARANALPTILTAMLAMLAKYGIVSDASAD